MTHEKGVCQIADYREIDLDALPEEVILLAFEAMHQHAKGVFTTILTRDLPPPLPKPTLDGQVAAYVLENNEDGGKYVNDLLRHHTIRYNKNAVKTLADAGLLLSKEELDEDQKERYCTMLASLVVAESVCSDAFAEDQKSRVLFKNSSVVGGFDELVTRMWPYAYAAVEKEFNTPNVEAYRRAGRLITDIYCQKFADVAEVTAERIEAEGISTFGLERDILAARHKKQDVYVLTGPVASGEHLTRLRTDRNRLRNNLGRVMVGYGAFLAGVQRREQTMELLGEMAKDLKRATMYLKDISWEVRRTNRKLSYIGDDIWEIKGMQKGMLKTMKESLFYQRETLDAVRSNGVRSSGRGYSGSADMVAGGLLGGSVGLLLGGLF